MGVAYRVVAPDVEELREGDPAEVVLENARRKASAGMRQVGEGSAVLAVDTDVALDGRLLGKAAQEEEARERLEALSGRTHEVLSGVVVLGPRASSPDSGKSARSHPGNDRERSGGGAERPAEPAERSGVSRSYVTFRDLSEGVVDLYLASGEWRDRAGAYAIQGLGSILIDRIEGDLSNVIGLPLRLLLELAPELASGELAVR